MARPGSIYCPECQKRSSEALRAPGEAGELDLDVVTLPGKAGQERAVLRRLERVGTHPCGLCGRPALPGRQYCSEGCRTRARAGERSQVELNGTVTTLLEHADRLGMPWSTIYTRLRRGLTPEQALTRPVDEEMRRRRLTP